MRKFFGTKEFYRNVFTIIIPIMVQQLFLSIAGYVDSLMINSFGTPQGIAYNGVSAANRLVFILNFFFLGLTAAVSIFTSQFFGANDRYKVRETARLSVYVSIIFGLIGSVVIAVFGKQVVNSYILDPIAREYGYDYLNVMKYGIVFIALNMSFATSLRSIQKPTIPLYVGIVGILVNIFLNWIMIFGHFGCAPLGATGAAIATVISKIVETIGYILIIKIKKFEMLDKMFKRFYISKSLLKDFIKRGTPIALNELAFSLSMVIMTKFVTYQNDLWYNAYSYTQNITDLFFIVFSGLANGTQIIIGADLGTSNFDKAWKEQKYFQGLGIMMGVTVGLLLMLTAPLTSKMFTSNEESIKLMIKIMTVTGIFCGVYCYNSVNFFTLRAGGDSIRAVTLDQFPTYFVGLPIVIIFGINATKLNLTVVELYLLSHACDVVKILIGNIFISQKKWLKNLTTINNDTLLESELQSD